MILRHSAYERSYPALGSASTGMGDRLRAGVPSRYVTSQLGQLSLASIRRRVPVYSAGINVGMSPLPGGR